MGSGCKSIYMEPLAMAIIEIEGAAKTKGRIRCIMHNPFRAGIPALEFEEYIERQYYKIRMAAKEIKNEFKRAAFIAHAMKEIDTICMRAQVSNVLYENVTCTGGRTEIAKTLANVATTATYIEYCAVGTGSTAPAITDTVLDTELYRKIFALTNQSGKTITFRTFFTTSEANGTLSEIGHFMDDATAAADSGTLFNHATISETKTSSTTLTTVFTLDINDG